MQHRQEEQDDISYFPPLRSNVASKMYEYELDSDELDAIGDIGIADEDILPSQRVGKNDSIYSTSDRGSQHDTSFEDDERDGPLLQGLLSEGVRRGSIDDRSPIKDGYLADIEALVPNLKGAGLFAGVANMANSILGAGIVGLPYATLQAGFVSGLVLLVILGGITDWTIRLIAVNAKLSGASTYIGITEACFGYPGRAACSLFQMAFAFVGMCAFCVVIGDTLPHVFASLLPWLADSRYFSFLFTRAFTICFFTITISYPLSLYRDIERLSKASALALVSMCTILLVVAIHGPQLSDERLGDSAQRWTIIAPGIPAAVGIISFAFVCHHNSLLIYGSLRVPTLDKFSQVTHVSTSFSVAATLAMAFSGFWSFTDKTQGNILNNFPPDDTWANIARFCFGLNMFTTLPLECFVCREVFETFFYKDAGYDRRRHFIFTTTIVFLALIVSLCTSDLGIMLELGGGCAAALLAYVFPAAAYLALAKDISRLSRWSAWACCGFGIAIFFATLYKGIARAFF